MSRPFRMKIGIIYLLLIIYIILGFPIFEPLFENIDFALFQFLCWFILWGYIIVEVGTKKRKIRKETDKLQIILIILILYFMIYFSSGLFLGYEYSPYSHHILDILLNCIKFLPIVIIKEYVRLVLVQNSKKRTNWLCFIVILFTLLDVNFQTLLSGNIEEIFKYTCSTLFPSIFRNMLLVYLALTCGFKSLLFYQLSFQLFYLIFPFFPKLDWFLGGIFEMLLPAVIFFQIHYLELNDSRLISRHEIQKGNPLRTAPLLILLIVMVGFVGGFFHYQPIAIISNSMIPEFQRGDAVVIEKANDKIKQNLKIGDIIQYQTPSKTIVHRIAFIIESENKEKRYITKGDNNNANDTEPVTNAQIKGIVKFTVPKVGYPSVWLYDLFQKKK